MKSILVLCLLMTSLHIFAQFGIRAGYGSTSYKDWEGFAYRRIDVNKASFLNSGLNVGLDYWFRLKKRRIEFMPELGYTQFASSSVDGYKYSLSSFNAYFNVHAYVLDLAEDCNCPTFSKGLFSSCRSTFQILRSESRRQSIHQWQCHRNRIQSRGWHRHRS